MSKESPEVKDMSVGVTNVVSKESPEATKPDFSIGHSIVSGRTNAQKIQAKKRSRDEEIMSR